MGSGWSVLIQAGATPMVCFLWFLRVLSSCFSELLAEPNIKVFLKYYTFNRILVLFHVF